MKYIFFGTPEFAAVVLEKLVRAGMPPAALVCNPDRPTGRKKTITAPATKILASGLRSAAPIFQPEKLDSGFRSLVSGLRPDFAVVAAYAKIIPREIIALFPKGVIGVHPSLLPKYRGSSPIQSAILGGEKETGVTLYLLDEKMDHGPILTSSELQVASSDTYLTLEKKSAELGGKLLIEILPKFVAGKIEPQTQNEQGATFTKKFITQDGFIEEKDLKEALSGANTERAIAIDRKIRALNPEPGVWTLRRGSGQAKEKRIKLLEAETEGAKLVLKKIQEEGGRPYSVAAS